MNDRAQNFNIASLAAPLTIGGVSVPNRVFLAPMSGVTDAPFRRLANEAGAGLVVSEMVASQEFVKGAQESLVRARPAGAAVHMVQLAGRDPYWMGEAAKALEAAGADMIDINMGCPAKKVTGGYSGSALMRDLDHAMTLIEATVSAVRVPVTLKMRLGWDDASVNAAELALRAQGAGVRMITVHGRTRCQFYTGSADWRAIRAVSDVITVPLVVNGDVRDLQSAGMALVQSGADAVMLGRACYGQPWLPGALAREAVGWRVASTGSMLDYVRRHYEAMLDHYGAGAGVRHARKHLGWYLDAHAPSASAEARQAVLTADTPVQAMRLMRDALEGHSSVCARDAA